MKTLILFFYTLLFSMNLKSAENLGFCSDLFHDKIYPINQTTRIKLTSDQVLVRGNLFAYWETGMEDHTLWSLSEGSMRHAYTHQFISWFFLGKGDYLYILDSSGDIIAKGYFGETHYNKEINLSGKKIETLINMPMLYIDAGLKEPAIEVKKLVTLFFNEAPAVVLKSGLREAELQELKLGALELEKHLKNPNRFVQIGKNRIYETQVGERVIKATIASNKKDPKLFNDSFLKEIYEKEDPKLRDQNFFFRLENGSSIWPYQAIKVFALDKNGDLINDPTHPHQDSYYLGQLSLLQPYEIYIVVAAEQKTP